MWLLFWGKTRLLGVAEGKSESWDSRTGDLQSGTERKRLDRGT